MTVEVSAPPAGAGVAPAPPGDGASTLTGLRPLLGLVLRRDRVRLVVWVLGIVALVVVSAQSVEGLYTTPAELQAYATLVRDNAALIVQAGPGHGLDDPTVGAVLMNEVSLWSIIGVALMSIFMVTRHTRAEEESERAELVRSAPVGRHAPAAAALSGVLLANLAVAAGVAAGLLAYGFPAAGSVAFGAALVGAGAVFAGVTLVCAQVAASARAATGLATAVLGVSFVLRAVGDVGNGALSWLSPIGWAQAIRAFADERWWVLLLPLATAGVLVVVADALTSHRDLGSGILPQRPGPAAASPRFRTTWALTVRLHRGSLVGWCAGLAFVGFFYGVVADEAESLIADNPDAADFLAQLGQGTITEAFLATSMLVVALISTGYTISAVLRMRHEETEGRVDALLATPVSRDRWVAGHLSMAVLGTVGVIGVGGLATGIGYASASGESGEIPSLLGAALVMVPAALVLGGVAAALFGVAPRLALLAWAAFAACIVVGFLGEVLDLPESVRQLSPYQHVPALPAAAFEVVPIVVLTAVAGSLAAVGFVGFRRRDVR